MIYNNIIISNTGAVFIYTLLILSLLGVLYFIYKKRKQANDESHSVSNFNHKISAIINKLDTPEEKIKALKSVYEKIDQNEEYDRNMAWKNSLKVTIFLHMMLSYRDLEDDDNVLSVCNRIIELNPKHAISFYNRGCIHYKHKEHDTALSDFEQYLVLDKKNKWQLREEVERLISEIKS